MKQKIIKGPGVITLKKILSRMEIEDKYNLVFQSYIKQQITNLYEVFKKTQYLLLLRLLSININIMAY